MKKITILALHLGYGGIERAIATLANTLINEYEIEIISTYKLYDKPCFPFHEKVKITYLIHNNLAKKVENYKILFFKFKWYTLWKELWKEYLKKGKIGSLVKDGVNGLLMYKKRKKEMIHFIRNCNSDIILSTRDMHNAWLSKYGKKEVYKIGWEHNHHNNNPKYIKKIVKSAQNLDAFVLVSKELYTFYKKKFQNKKCKIVYIPNAIDKVNQKSASLIKKNIITVGRLSKEKGHIDLIEIMDIVRKKTENFHISIIGDGPEREKIEREIQKYKLESKITILGFQKKEEVQKELLSSSIFLLPSYTESFGIVVLEAFAEGVPVIAFDSAKGALEMIQNGKNGYVIKNRDKQEMAKKICFLLNNKKKRKELGKNAKEVAKQYEAQTVKKKWVDLFEKEK